ncbi:MAG: aldo/keto reductase [Thermoplasmata archaeon]|nr:aldo/keto reductase [Thermoplasmata archaeon]NIT77669.1 aldo/keto reductase [Thermoplasmata archaeon]NIY04039.1 aldo/keto reductase [Thermoplasmata archaeon]
MAEARTIKDRRRLGRSDLEVTSVGLGVWQWGDTNFWGYGQGYDREDLDAVWWANIEAGVNFIDTAEIYGHGASETIVGDLLDDTDAPMVIATKLYPEKDSHLEVRKAAEGSLRRLGVDVIDLYQVHWWPPRMDVRGMMRELDTLVRDGLVRYVGVSNFSVEQVEEAQSHLEHTEIVSNQVHYSLLHRDPETEGLVDHHGKNGIAIIAYSPIEQGILTGKFGPDNRPGGFRAKKPRFSREGLEAVQPVLAELDAAAKAHGRTMAQAAMAWLLKDPNVVVIPGAKNLTQLEENVGCADWQLTQAEVDRIEAAYREYAKRF